MAVGLLKKVDYLKHLPDRALKRLDKIALLRTFKEGEMIISQKEAGKHLFIVKKGRVKIFVASRARKQKTFAVISKGEFFGELALLEGEVRTASAQATEDTELLLVPKKDFQRLLTSDPGFTMLLLRTMAERLRKTNETIESLLFKNVLGRVAKALVDLNEKSRRGGGRGAAALKITHRDLAGWVGTSREPLSRALAVLRRGGLIEADHGEIRIADLEKLRRLT